MSCPHCTTDAHPVDTRQPGPREQADLVGAWPPLESPARESREQAEAVARRVAQDIRARHRQQLEAIQGHVDPRTMGDQPEQPEQPLTARIEALETDLVALRGFTGNNIDAIGEIARVVERLAAKVGVAL